MNSGDELKDYLVTKFERNKQDGSITLTQPQMVKRILELVGINYDSKTVKISGTPACINKLLDNAPDSKPRVQKWNYRAVVGF